MSVIPDLGPNCLQQRTKITIKGKRDKFLHTRYSSVRPISSIDFTPADTTATGVRPSSVRSALISIAIRRQKKTIYNPSTLYLLVSFAETFANSLDPDKAQQNESELFDTDSVLTEVLEKVCFEKYQQTIKRKCYCSLIWVQILHTRRTKLLAL